jgi:antitoxin MazE
MELQIGKWGNSLAVRLPNALVRQLCVQEGSVLHTEVLGAQTLGISASSPAPTRRELVAQLRVMHAAMPPTRRATKEEMSRY